MTRACFQLDGSLSLDMLHGNAATSRFRIRLMHNSTAGLNSTTVG
jgi:hypothetical protein